MQQIRKTAKQKAFQKLNAFISVNSSWCAIVDVKITLPDEEESEAGLKEIRELLNDSAHDKKEALG